MPAKIISAFPGCGKTTYFNEWSCYVGHNYGEKILDSDSSLFSWIYDENGNKTNVRNPEFPMNYIKHIKEHIDTEDVIFVSSHKVVREALEKEGINYILVYPSKDKKREWMFRFKERGNTPEFIKFQDEHWDEFINDMDAETFPTKIVLDNHAVGWDAISVDVMNYLMDYECFEESHNIETKQTERCTITNEFTETNGYISSYEEKTAEVRPIVRAKWVDRPNPRWKAPDTRHCSECGWSISMNILRDADLKWNYCPNCGAFMHLIKEKRRGE